MAAISPVLGVACRATAPATCGELAQGVLGQDDFLINSPMGMGAVVSVTLNNSGEVEIQTPGIFTKLATCVKRTLHFLGFPELGASVRVHSSIPRGKGLASSTAELSAGIWATTQALGSTLRPEDISRFLLEVDTTDGVYYPGIVRINHLAGKLQESFGAPPPIDFLIVDTGGAVETNGFDRERARAVARAHHEKLSLAVAMIRRGFQSANARYVAMGATLSASVNQNVLYKPEFVDLLKGSLEAGALGVNCAHTGTVLGIMYDPRETKLEPLQERVESLIGKDRILGSYPLVSGGLD